MGIGSRPATCASCGKRLNRKSWFYRNGKFYCKRRCWMTESTKAAEQAATGQAKVEGKAPAKGAEAATPSTS